MNDQLAAILREQLDDILSDPDQATLNAREAGFWRGAIRGLTRNFADDPAYIAIVLAALVTHTENAK